MGTLSTTEIAIRPAEVAGSDEGALELEFTRALGQITHHSLVFFAGTLFTMAAGYLVKMYVVRILGAELLGIYALGVTLASLAQLFGVLGLPSAAARYVSIYTASGRADHLRSFLGKTSGVVLLLNSFLALIIFFRGSWIAQHLYHSPKLAYYIPLFAVLIVLGGLAALYGQVLAGFKDVAKRTVINNFVGTPTVLILTVMLLATGYGLRGYLAAQIVSSALVLALLIRAVWKLLPKTKFFSSGALPALEREVYSFSAASFAMSGIDFLSSQADKIIIGIYLAAKPVGIYVLASTLAAFVPILLQSVNQIFAPVIADLHAQGRHDLLHKLFQTLTRSVFALSLPLGLVLIGFAPAIMRFFGPDFERGWPVLAIIAAGQIVNCAVGSVGYLLLMSGNQKRLMRVQFTMAIVSLVVNVSPRARHHEPAALVNAGSNVWNLVEVRRGLGLSPYNRSYYELVFPAGLTIGALAVLRWLTTGVSQQWLVFAMALSVAYGVFALTMIGFGIDKNDRRMLSGVFRQFSGLRRFGVAA